MDPTYACLALGLGWNELRVLHWALQRPEYYLRNAQALLERQGWRKTWLESYGLVAFTPPSSWFEWLTGWWRQAPSVYWALAVIDDQLVIHYIRISKQGFYDHRKWYMAFGTEHHPYVHWFAQPRLPAATKLPAAMVQHMRSQFA
jgi:hypothetical protein